MQTLKVQVLLLVTILSVINSRGQSIPDYIATQFKPSTAAMIFSASPGSILSFASVGILDSLVTLFGGTTFPGNNFVTDIEEDIFDQNSPYVWRFDLLNRNWTQLSLSYNQFGQCSHQHGNNVYLYGGKVTENFTSLFLRLNLADTDPQNFTEYRNVNTTSEIYTVYTSCAMHNNMFYVFGGAARDSDEKVTSQLRSIDTADMAASAKDINSVNESLVKPLIGASLVSYMGNELILTGASYTDRNLQILRYDITSNTWTQDHQPQISPPPIMHHISAIFGSTLLVFGGKNLLTNNSVNNLWSYDLSVPGGNWSHVTPMNGSWPIPFFGAASVSKERRIIFYGGNSDDAYASSVWQLVPEITCTSIVKSCGECILAGFCGICNLNSSRLCVAGNSLGPYVPGTCDDQFQTDPLSCRPDIIPAPWIIPSTITALVLIFILLVVTYILDRRKALETDRAYYDRLE